tara:strand:+ start:4720 stop:7125 length:2406 start_codon:yes stop_codon:yes gene_type:complete
MSAIDLDVNIKGVVDEGSFEIAGNKALEKIIPTSANVAKSTDNVSKSMDQLVKRFKLVRGDAHHTSEGLSNLGVNVKDLNKSTASANQTLFAFSDLVQDSTQFSQGFAQGMRAIGNNVGFTAELFANLRSRVQLNNQAIRLAGGDTRNLTSVTKELGRSLRGVGGILIAVNAGILLLQRRADKGARNTKKLREEGKATAEAFLEVSKSIGDFNSGIADPFALRQRSRQIAFLKLQLGGLSEEQLKAAITERALSESRENLAQITTSFVEIAQEAPNTLRTLALGIEDFTGPVGHAIGAIIRPLAKLVFDFDGTISKIPDEILPPVAKEVASLLFAILSPTRKFSLLTGQSGDDVNRLGQVLKDAGLGDQIDKITESFNKITEATFGNAFKILLDPIGELQERFAGLSFEAAKFAGKISEEDIARFEAARALRQEVERQELTQNALNNVLKQAIPTFDDFTKTLEELETTQTILNSRQAGFIHFSQRSRGTIKNETKSRRELIKELKNQGNIITLDLARTNESIDAKQLLVDKTKSETDAQKELALELEKLGVTRDTQQAVLSQIAKTVIDLEKPLIQTGERLEKLSLQFTPFMSAGERFRKETNLMVQSLEKVVKELNDPVLNKAFANFKKRVDNFVELQELSMEFKGLSDLGKGLGQFGEVFGATKDFRLAMALVDGGAAIVSALADPTLGVAAKIGASLGIAAQVKQQIDQIKKVKLGSGGNVTRPTQDTQPQFTQSISFANPTTSEQPPVGTDPANVITASRFQNQPKIVNNIVLDRKGLAIASNRGQQELENNSVTI